MNRNPRSFHDLLRDLPESIQRAVHECVAACKPHYRPRPYGNDWLEELYHEAACAACEALAKHDPERGNLYEFGKLVIGQRLRRFCDRVWAAARCECEWLWEKETDEEVEFQDERADAEREAQELVLAVEQVLERLLELDKQVGKWYLLEGWSEGEIAERLGCSQPAVSKRLKRVIAHVRAQLGAEGRFR